MLRRSFEPQPTSHAGYGAARRWLRRAFTRWAQANTSEFGPDCFEGLIHYKWSCLDGHLTRWRRADLDTVLLELFPAKVVVEDADLADVVPEAMTFVRFLADTGLLDPASDRPDVLRAHLQRIEGRFRQRMAQRSRYGPGKRFWLAASEAGVDIDDNRAVAAFVKRFNASSDAERETILGARPASLDRGGRATPPGRRSPSQRNRRGRRKR